MTPDRRCPHTADDLWQTECAAFIQQFAARAADWGEHSGDLVEAATDPWTDLDHPDDRLDAAYRGGIVPPAQRYSAADDGWDQITVLRARGRRLAKHITSDCVIGYDSAKRFDFSAVPVDGVDHLEEDLRRLLLQPDRCIVRGAIADLGRATGVRRLLHADDDDAVSMVEVPRRWLALDIDHLARPENVAVADIRGCAEIAAAALPVEFRGVRCIAQATGSHGIKPGIRMRLWYWLDRALCGVELKRWLIEAPVDHALFSAAQLIYTAAPVFQDRRDPLANRMIRLPGRPQVTVPELPEPERRAELKPVTPATGLSRYAEVALDNACRRIAGAKEGDRDRTINAEAYGIGRLAGAGAVPSDFALRTLHHALAAIPGHHGKRDGDKVERSFRNGIRNPRETL